MIVLRRTYTHIALMCSTQCMGILAVLSAFSGSNAVLEKAVLLTPYFLMVGTSKFYDTFDESCGERKSIHSPVFCNSRAERCKRSYMFTSKLKEKEEERFKSTKELVYQSNLEKERKSNQQKKEGDGKGDAAPMNIKKIWMNMWNSEQVGQREDKNKKEGEMRERQEEEMKNKKIKDKIKKWKFMKKKLRKEKERKMEQERKQNEQMRKEYNDRKRTERCFKRDRNKEETMMRCMSNCSYFFI